MRKQGYAVKETEANVSLKAPGMKRFIRLRSLGKGYSKDEISKRMYDGVILCDMAKNIGELAFDYLDAPVVTLGARNWITPAFEFEKYFYPQASWILDAINQRILPLAGYAATRDDSDAARMRAAREGV